MDRPSLAAVTFLPQGRVETEQTSEATAGGRWPAVGRDGGWSERVVQGGMCVFDTWALWT